MTNDHKILKLLVILSALIYVTYRISMMLTWSGDTGMTADGKATTAVSSVLIYLLRETRSSDQSVDDVILRCKFDPTSFTRIEHGDAGRPVLVCTETGGFIYVNCDIKKWQHPSDYPNVIAVYCLTQDGSAFRARLFSQRAHYGPVGALTKFFSDEDRFSPSEIGNAKGTIAKKCKKDSRQ